MPADDLAQWRQVVNLRHLLCGHKRRFSGRQSRGESQRCHEAERGCTPSASDIECSAVIWRGPHKRQAKRNIDGAVEGEGLDRDQRLVVIHAERHVITGARALVEQRIGWQRPKSVNPLRLQPRDCRRHDSPILLTERAALTGMRIEAGDSDAWPRDAETPY